MTDRIIVFIGPTLPRDEVLRLLPGADVRPPAAHGDLLAAAADAATIVLVDGVFEAVPSVWHKEILYALSRGVRVIGAASIGALRAAECAPFGMEPIGRIAEQYLRGERTKDADVAVAHAAADRGWHPLSEPIVNVEATLDAAVSTGVLTPHAATTLRDAAGRQFYAHRTWRSILDAADPLHCEHEELQAFAAWLSSGRVDRKAEDARAALLACRRSPSVVPIDWTLVRTTHLDRALRRHDLERSAGNVPAEHLVDEVRVRPDLHAALVGRARLRALALLLAERSGVAFGAEELGSAMTELLVRRGITEHDDVRTWVADEGLDARALAALLRAEAALDWALRVAQHEVSPAMLHLLAADGRGAEARRRARHKQQLLEECGYDAAAIERSATDEDALRWLWSDTGGEPPDDTDAWLAAHGYVDAREAASAARRERLYRMLGGPAPEDR
jgi:hypothetical protein